MVVGKQKVREEGAGILCSSSSCCCDKIKYLDKSSLGGEKRIILAHSPVKGSFHHGREATAASREGMEQEQEVRW